MNPAALYILQKQEPLGSIFLKLQATVEIIVPKAEFLFKWKLSFYYVQKNPFCFLNFSKNYVDLVF